MSVLASVITALFYPVLLQHTLCTRYSYADHLLLLRYSTSDKAGEAEATSPGGPSQVNDIKQCEQFVCVAVSSELLWREAAVKNKERKHAVDLSGHQSYNTVSALILRFALVAWLNRVSCSVVKLVLALTVVVTPLTPSQ